MQANKEITITAKLLIKPTDEQKTMLLEAGRAFSKACNYVSGIVFETHNLNQISLQKQTYDTLRVVYDMPSQMACNVIRHVIGNYRTILTNEKEWIKLNFAHNTYPLSWNRDYQLHENYFSVGTLKGRVKLFYDDGGMEKYFDGTWRSERLKLLISMVNGICIYLCQKSSSNCKILTFPTSSALT